MSQLLNLYISRYFGNSVSSSMNDQSCPFNCGFCKDGQPHVCKKCNAKNLHRSSDCGKSVSFNSSKQSVVNKKVTFSDEKISTAKPSLIDRYGNILEGKVKVVTLTIILNKKYILVCIRNIGGKCFGYLSTTGGSIDACDRGKDDDDTHRRAAVRECFEESGVKCNESDLIHINYHQMNGSEKYIRRNFIVHISKLPDKFQIANQFLRETQEVEHILGVKTNPLQGNNRWAAVDHSLISKHKNQILEIIHIAKLKGHLL